MVVTMLNVMGYEASDVELVQQLPDDSAYKIVVK